MKHALVGVLSAGEPTLPKALAAIRNQAGITVEIVHISDLPKHEAHRLLYKTFTARTDRFDLLAKVDADMEILHPRLLSSIAGLFDAFPEVDLAPVAVDDWLSGRQIWSLNVWRGGIRWLEEPPDLFSDQARNTSRQAFSLLKVGQPLVLHAAHATPLQALRYGAHRALKARSSQDVGRIRAVERTVRFCAAEPCFERNLVLLAIEMSLRDPELGRLFVDTPTVKNPVATATARARVESASDLSARVLQQLDELRTAISLELQSERPREVRTLSRGGRAQEASRKPPLLRVMPAVRRMVLRLLGQPTEPHEVLMRGLGIAVAPTSRS